MTGKLPAQRAATQKMLRFYDAIMIAKQQADSNTRTLVPEAEFTLVNVINARWQAMLITIPYNLSEIQGTT